MKFSVVFLLFYSACLQAFTVPPHAEIALSNGCFVQASELEDGDLALVHDVSGKEHEAEIVNVEIKADSVNFEVLDYNHFKSNKSWIYEATNLKQGYAIVSAEKITSPRSAKFSLKKFLPLVALGAIVSIPTVGATTPACWAVCVGTCRTVCAVASFLVPAAMGPLCFAVETTGACEEACLLTGVFPC